MKKLSSLLAVAVIVSSSSLIVACGPERVARAGTTGGRVEPPVQPPAASGHYCNMGFFTPEGLARHKALVPKVAAAVTARQELENGYLFRFSGQVKEAGEWIDGVRGCCATLDYAVTFSANAGPSTLRITGGPGAKEFIREEFAQIVQP